MVVPVWVLRLVGVLLALSMALVHISDQGGLTAFTLGPAWQGYSYYAIEAGAALTALLLIVLPQKLVALAWAGAALLGAGPVLGYLASRWPGVPQDTYDIGNWSWTGTGTLDLSVGIALTILSGSMLWSWWKSRGKVDA